MSQPAQDSVEEYRMPILDHLRELRLRVVRAMQAVLVGLLIGWFVSDPVFDFLTAPMNDALAATGAGTLAVTQTTEALMVKLKVAGITGVFLASPVIFWQVWQFVAPGLYATEKKYVLPLVVSSSSLFATGAAFAYYGVFRFGFPWFLEMNGENVTAVLSIESYLSFATTLLVAFGSSFQLPIIVFFLARMGIVNHHDMIHGFRYGIILIAIASAVLTPPDIMSMAMMGVPLIVLYGVGIVVARLFSTKPVAES